MFKPHNYFLRELPGGFDKFFMVEGVTLPLIEVASGNLLLASTDTPPEAGSILTLTDTLVFDPTPPDTYEVELQVREGLGPWVALAHDIVAEPYEIPAFTVETSWRARAVATEAGYETRVVSSNVLTALPSEGTLFGLLGFDDEQLLGYDDEPLEYEP